MAEARSYIMPGDATVTIEDATGTPLTYSVKLTEGTITCMDGEWEHVMPTDADGSPLSGGIPRKGAPRSLCGLRFQIPVWDAGDNSTDATLADIVRWDGVVGSTWVSTTSSPDSQIKTVNVRVVWADRGSVKGATWLYPNCRITGGFEPVARRDGAMLADLEFRSLTAVKPTVTRTA